MPFDDPRQGLALEGPPLKGGPIRYDDDDDDD